MSLCCDFAGNDSAAKAYLEESIQINNENQFALYFDKFGFLK
jgi:hypothetical protein